MSNIYDIEFSNLTMEDSLITLEEVLFENKKDCKHIITANPEVAMISKKNKALKKAIDDSFMVTADGIGVIIASKIINEPLKERVTGFDLINNLFKKSNSFDRKINVFLLGAIEENVSLAAKNIKDSFPNVNVVGYRNGFFTPKEEEEIVDLINFSNVDLLLVGLGCPKQEEFIYNNKEKLEVNVAIGCGGSIDVFSGNVKRAPIFFQKNGIEWLYRLISQPSRIKRQIALPLFLVNVFLGKRRG